MDLDQLLPEYPSLHSDSFYYDLYRKKEFNDLKTPKKINLFYSHQLIVARFISNWTLYQSLLLIHDTGTGKSGVAAAAFDGLKENNPDLNILYITNNDTLLRNFKREIYNLSGYMMQKRKEEEEAGMDTQDSYKRNSLLKKAGFTFTTYHKFAASFKKSKKSSSFQLWDRQLIILDEVHHLISRDVDMNENIKKARLEKKKKNVGLIPYDEIHAFLHSLEFKKLLLLTATPIRESPSEIAPLLNLVLPDHEQLPTGPQFLEDYFNAVPTPGRVPSLEWKEPKRKEFMEKIKGYISVVKQSQAGIEAVPMGFIYPPMQNFRLFARLMGDVQTKGYMNAFQIDTRNQPGKGKEEENAIRSFYSHAQQASLFVFPDLSYGISKEVVKKGSKAGEDKYFYQGKFTGKFIKETGMVPMEHKSLNSLTKADREKLDRNLVILTRYSSTYSSIIDHIIHKRDQQIYVYCHKIYGSGIKLCIQLLTQFFGYSSLKKAFQGSGSRKKKIDWKKVSSLPRLILLHEENQEEEESSADIENLIEAFNNPENKNGRKIQVIFGTDKTREGISLKRIEQIHVCASDWNFGKIFQALGRGIRLHSHLGMPEGTKVKIFMHCALPHSSLVEVKNPTLPPKQKQLEQLQQQQQQQKQQQQQQQQEGDDWLDIEQGEVPIEIQIQENKLESPLFPDAVPPTSLVPSQLDSSIDFFRYYRSELKDKNIKNIEYAMLIGAMDCQLNKIQNSRSRYSDGSPECWYRECNYTCEGFESSADIIPVPLDDSTYNLYYIQSFIPETIRFIQNLFSQQTILPLETILKAGKESEFTSPQIMETLRYMMDKPIRILFHDGRKLYLQNQQDTFFLSDQRMSVIPGDKKQLWMGDYSDNPSFVIQQPFDSLLEKMMEKNFNKLCCQMVDFHQKNDAVGALEIFQLFSLEFKSRFLYLLTTTEAKDLVFTKWIRENVVPRVLVWNTERKEWFWIQNSGKTLVLDSETRTWQPAVGGGKAIKMMVPAGKEEESVDHESAEFIDQYVKGKVSYGYYVDGNFMIRDVSKSQFFTVDASKRKKTSGRMCKNGYQFKDLLYFLWAILPGLPEEDLIREIPEALALKKELEKMSPADLYKKVVRSVPMRDKFFEKIGKTMETANRDDLLFLKFYSKIFHNRLGDFCSFLQKIYQQKKLISLPPGTSIKGGPKKKGEEKQVKEPKKRGRKPKQEKA